MLFRSANNISLFVKAMYPWPEAYTFWKKKNSDLEPQRIIIKKGIPILNSNCVDVPGTTICVNDKGIDIATKQGIFRILSLQKSGKKQVDVKEFIAGNKIEPGDMFI